MNKKKVIEIRDLTRYYKGRTEPAVDHLSLDVLEGTIFGLLGPNGAGKTTTIRILCGLLAPTGGDAIIDGYSLKRDLIKIKRVIGVVPQEIALYPTLTARENLLVFGGISGVERSELKKRIDHWLDVFGLGKSQRQQTCYYSGGMKRRLNLIAGLLHNPRILFLDEPTVGVDVQSKNVILENLMEINRKGTTIVYTSHYLEEAENLCSHLAIIDEGRIITRGTLNEIQKEHNMNAKLEDIFLQLTGKELRD